MKLSAILSVSQAALTSYIAKDGNRYDITPGCPETWPQNTNSNTFIPPWVRECPPLDLCFPNTAYNRADAPDARCKDENGGKANLESCCTDGYKKFSSCYSACAAGYATNLDGKQKVEYNCKCTQKKGCYWQLQGNDLNDLTCTDCNGVRRIDWNTSGKKQADFFGHEGAQGVDGKILSAGWIHKVGENVNDYFILLSLQGIELETENVMVWNYDLVGVYSEGFAANQWYTFANTIIVLKPNANSPQGPFSPGDVTNIMVGLENINDSMWTQDNIDNKIVEYFVGYVGGSAFQGVPYVFDCINSHFGADPRSNDQDLTDFIPETL